MNYNKNNRLVFYFLTTFICLTFSCSSKSESSRASEKTNNSLYKDEEDVTNGNNSGCKYEDGTYSAIVDYNNPETGYSTTYTLDVDVQNCKVVQINFPNDGYLDENHISYADIDKDGTATVYGEDGKTYEIQIDE